MIGDHMIIVLQGIEVDLRPGAFQKRLHKAAGSLIVNCCFLLYSVFTDYSMLFCQGAVDKLPDGENRDFDCLGGTDAGGKSVSLGKGEHGVRV